MSGVALQLPERNSEREGARSYGPLMLCWCKALQPPRSPAGMRILQLDWRKRGGAHRVALAPEAIEPGKQTRQHMLALALAISLVSFTCFLPCTVLSAASLKLW